MRKGLLLAFLLCLGCRERDVRVTGPGGRAVHVETGGGQATVTIEPKKEPK